MTVQGDLILVTMEGQPAFFARIEEISADVKPEWFQVKMLVLQVPLMVITWILRESYISGEEFTMGGRPIQLTKVVAPEQPEDAGTGEPQDPLKREGEKPAAGAKVVSLADRLKNK